MQPPKVRFKTRIVHPNVDYDTGEICLDLLKDRWAPVYTLEQTVEAIRDLMRHPATDSPLNVDAAILLRVGDEIGFKSLVDYLYHEVSP
ncbi:ubiquitin-conjugating enzyme/RWD-like protein [Gorgonomyces haynaldii]|nr:ubiquitin-conjugating enzyme/RWD-like protein [Gorgonomyces haynaldii]